MKLYKPSYSVGAFAIRPHPLAPLFDSKEFAERMIPDLLRFKPTEGMSPGSETFKLIQQLGYVSLWFFLRVICGAPGTGPYDDLDDPLSIDMCNTRQHGDFEDPGARGAAFIPRGFFKSTIFSHGGNTWDLVRDPEETIAIGNAVYEKAMEFVKIIQGNFTNNPLMATFYPKHCDFRSRDGSMTSDRMILPNKKKRTVEPSIRALGVGGAAEGGHFSLLDLDDLVGLDSVDQSRASNANMETAKKWFRTNRRALLRSQEESRVIVVATRYAVDDCYEDIYKSARVVHGWQKGDLQPKADGEWAIYWRKVEEDGYYIKPKVMNEKEYSRLMVEDYWSAATQYANEPAKAGLAEFSGMKIGIFSVKTDDDGRIWLIRDGDENYGTNAVLLDDCDVVMTIDPAGTGTGLAAKTCRTSVGVWASDSGNRKYRLDSSVGFMSVTKMMNEIFRIHRTWKGYIRITLVESNAYQNILAPLMKEEEREREQYINPQPVLAKGDKKARIRSAIGDYGMQGKLWVTMQSGREFLEELRIFPMSENRMDVLDESEKGIVFSQRPESTEERLQKKAMEEEHEVAMGLNAFGY
jgi:hypothetical protein